MIKKDVNVLRHEFIGKKVEVGSHKIKGKIIDETKNSFVIDTTKGKKRVMKNGTAFQLTTDKGVFEIEGNQIAFRPEDRIKIKKWK